MVKDREAWGAAVHGGRKESDMTEWLKWTETDDQKLRWVKKEAEKQPKRKQERGNWQITKGTVKKKADQTVSLYIVTYKWSKHTN